jgi:hypothetical protein
MVITINAKIGSSQSVTFTLIKASLEKRVEG